MIAPFDHIATHYDSDFTLASIGKLQRSRVWNYLENILPTLEGNKILELNCGTGEDAIMLAKKGFTITATDVSTEMLKVTNLKICQYLPEAHIETALLDLTCFEQNTFTKKFDLIFSNFGGLNCIGPADMEKLLKTIPAVLSPQGRLIAVIMPKFCIWESFFFLLKGRLKKAFRRLTNKSISANLSGSSVNTWYYTPSQIKQLTKDNFELVALKPIGIALPPSYLEKFFATRKHWLFRLNSLEEKFGNASFLSAFSDHYLIDLKLK
jgi:ubiquinone/menaquinone biosynthesis C-methylase UbiE